jgi:hypothetical protein
MNEASKPPYSSIYSSDTIRRKTVGLTLRQDLYAISREYGINLSRLLENSLIQLIDQSYKPKASFLGKASFYKRGVSAPAGI